MRQPPAGWQTLEPVLPYDPQNVLQHLLTVVMFVELQAVQVVPSTSQVLPGIAWQVPAPVAPIWQTLVQQSLSL
jgi:hypothetical protein